MFMSSLPEGNRLFYSLPSPSMESATSRSKVQDLLRDLRKTKKNPRFVGRLHPWLVIFILNSLRIFELKRRKTKMMTHFGGTRGDLEKLLCFFSDTFMFNYTSYDDIITYNELLMVFVRYSRDPKPAIGIYYCSSYHHYVKTLLICW